MNEPRASELPVALRAGRLEGINLPDLLWALCRRRSTGVLRLAGRGAEKALYLERGRIVFAASSDPDDRLGELLLRQGRIDLDQLEQAIARLHTGKRLGTLLVECGALTADQLVRGVLAQVERTVLSLFELEEGDYRFEDGPLPTEEVITLGMRTGEMLLRGIRRIRSFGRIRRSVGGPHKVFGLADGWRGLAEGLGLSEGEQALLDRLRAGDATVETLCREVFLSNFEIYQALWGFQVIGLVEEREARTLPATDATQRGTLDEGGFAGLLVRLGRAGETGVLYLTRGTHERTFHICAGRCVFATSNDPDDGLVAYLLRRGVISLTDREETAKRLLSNKRVGTILRELGVIDERDLRDMVRQQLAEIVYDTFRWGEADWAFVRGSLPSVEEITLEDSVDAIVAAGLRRIDSWSRVWRGCGGLETPLELRPSYLAVLDAMEAGAEEWRVVNALKTARTARDVCRVSELGNFRVCQVLWTLRLLGAIDTASAAPRADAAVDVAVGSLVAPEAPATVAVTAPPVEEPVRISVEEQPARIALEIETSDEPVVALEIDRPEPPEPHASPAIDETQILHRGAIEAALRREPAVVEETGRPGFPARPPVDATQAISPAELAAAQAGDLAAAAEDTGPIGFDELEAALDAPTAAPVEEAPWSAPADLDDSIARFNTLHRVVYRTVRAEVGAGAPNFIRASCARGAGELVDQVSLHGDGSWDVDGLRRSVLDRRVDDPWRGFLRVLELEVDRVREFLGEAREQELRQQLDKAEQTVVRG